MQLASQALPRCYWGVWWRSTLSIAGAEPREPCDVLWLQGPSYFADLRTPRPGCATDGGAFVAAFSGKVAWRDPEIVFRRDLDLDTRAGEDRAELHLRGGELREVGIFHHPEGRQIPYEEIWCRGREGGSDFCVLEGRLSRDPPERPSMRWVEAGAVAIGIVDERPYGGGFGAAHFVRNAGEWRRVRETGPVCIKPPPIEVSCAVGESVTLRAGEGLWGARSWLLRERVGLDARAYGHS